MAEAIILIFLLNMGMLIFAYIIKKLK